MHRSNDREAKEAIRVYQGKVAKEGRKVSKDILEM